VQNQAYGLNPQYRPQRLVINYSWDIPSGGAKGVLGALVKGWTLAGVTTIQGGQPLSVLDTGGGSIYGVSGSPALLASSAFLSPGTTYSSLQTTGGTEARLGGASGGCGYFACTTPGVNTAANYTGFLPLTCKFTGTVYTSGVCANAGGTLANGTPFGNSGIGSVLGPGQFDFDTTVSKTTRVGGIHEDARLQFRAEFFNLFNHPQFAVPAGLNLGAPANFGQITTTSVNPRLIQLALKYQF